ncbi:hypothetical protein J6590_054349 [Homalodisca vitripennis]|nr:hypothetical protein J6590_054349 [Homalodisca vitripennis]
MLRSRCSGAVTAGTEETQNENSVSFDSSVDSTNFETSSDKTTENRQGKTQDSTAEQRKVTGPNVKQAKKKLKLIETEETKDLTLPELQRLVLLKQLEYLKKAEKLVDIQLKREESKEIDQPQSTAPSEQNGISTEELQAMIGTSYSTTYCDGLEFTTLASLTTVKPVSGTVAQGSYVGSVYNRVSNTATSQGQVCYNKACGRAYIRPLSDCPRHWLYGCKTGSIESCAHGNTLLSSMYQPSNFCSSLLSSIADVSFVTILYIANFIVLPFLNVKVKVFIT